MAVNFCPQCKQKVPLYKCPVCGVTAHIDKKKKETVIHLPSFNVPKHFEPRQHTGRISYCFPSHVDCEIFKPITQIDLSKLEKVEAHT